MKPFLLLTIIFLITQNVISQKKYDISFVIKKDTITRSAEKEVIYLISFKAKNIDPDFKNYKLSIQSDQDTTTLSSNEYKINFKETKLSDLDETNTFFIIFPKDSLSDRDRKLLLKIVVLNNEGKEDSSNSGDNKKMALVIKGIESNSINDYSYLAYIGTNFDLVDGLKANNLFFAANVFLPPGEINNKVGVYLSLYGNRTMTATDSTSNVIRDYKFTKITDTSYWKHSAQFDMRTSRVSDNLGAYISPLIKIWGASKFSSNIRLFYSPSLEFVWRRTQTTNSFSNVRLKDSIVVIGDNVNSIEFGDKSVQYSNEYSFNVGLLSFFLVHENKQISVRVHCSVGYSSNYLPEHPNGLSTETTSAYKTYSDMFFTGRAWITEATTGITLQAEITNTLINPRPYYGVTLSKAINFKSIGTIFQPITAR